MKSDRVKEIIYFILKIAFIVYIMHSFSHSKYYPGGPLYARIALDVLIYGLVSVFVIGFREGLSNGIVWAIIGGMMSLFIMVLIMEGIDKILPDQIINTVDTIGCIILGGAAGVYDIYKIVNYD